MILELGNVIGGFLTAADGLKSWDVGREAISSVQKSLEPYRSYVARVLVILALLNLLDRWFYGVGFLSGSYPQSIAGILAGLSLDPSLFPKSGPQEVKALLGTWQTAIGVYAILVGLYAIL